MKTYAKFYINGSWVEPIGPGTINVVNPATEETVGHVAAGTAADVDAAVKAARNAFESWSQSSVDQRVGYLEKIIRGVEARATELSEVVTSEMGIPASLAYGWQVESVPMILSDFIRILQKYPFELVNEKTTILREPIGVCGLITPWNYPLAQIAVKVAPALAAGCTIILKPSEVAPLCAGILAEIIDDAAVPPGVFNLINGYGSDVGTSIAAHPDIDMVSFTGSTRAGISVAKMAADTVKRVTQELGGKSASIILDDAEIDPAVRYIVEKCFGNSGQSCDAPTRMLVPAAMQQEVVKIAKATAEGMRVGNPLNESVTLGPVASEAQYDKVTRLIRQGIEEGAELIAGGPDKPKDCETGYFVQPTVFASVDNRMTIAQEEIFGPVICIIPYENEDDAVRIANGTKYGLAAYISTESSERADRVSRRLRSGQVRINKPQFDSTAPFGGYKMSGNGRELGTMGLEEYLETKACMGLES